MAKTQKKTLPAQDIETLNTRMKAAQDQGQLELERELAREILAHAPQRDDVWHRLGYLEYDLGAPKAAIESIQSALKIKQTGEYQNSLGFMYYRTGDFPNAALHFEKATQIDESFALAFKNLGSVYYDQRDWTKAAQGFANAVLKDPKNSVYKQWLLQTFLNYDLKHFDAGFKRAMTLCLMDSQIDHRMMAPKWRMYFEIDPAMMPVRRIAAYATYESFAKDTKLDDLIPSLKEAFLILGAQKLIMPSPDFEKSMTYLRRFLLDKFEDFFTADSIATAMNFIYGLSHQCWLNEYIYSISDEEIKRIDKIKKDLKKNIRNSDEDVLKLLILSLYEPLYKLKNAETIVQIFDISKNHNLRTVIKVQIKDPLEEEKIKSTIISRNAIKNDVSKKVRQQYEENPYPRWRDTYITKNSKRENEVLSILMAGCGTGMQSASQASTYPKANIYNVDLSLSSLAYAIRQTRELKIPNLTFEHADILELESLNHKFDIIVCSGVLHHMKEPEKGLKVLKSLLKPEGKLLLALYSKAGRKDIIAAQNYIKKKGYKATPEGIRQARQDIMAEPDIALKRLVQTQDFYSLSQCRDLLFHVQEYCYDIAEIEKMLKDQNLSFLNFFSRIDRNFHKFKERFGEDHQFDLEKWAKFENENPDVFANMYVFWACHDSAFETLQKDR